MSAKRSSPISLAGNGSADFEENAVLERQLEMPMPKPSFFNLFRYSTRLDKIILSVALICSIAAGAVNPIMTLVFGKLALYFQGFLAGTTDSRAFAKELSQFTLYYVYLGIGQFFLTYVSIVGHTYVGEHVTAKIRENYLAAILRQNIAFFDNLGSGEITNHMTVDTNLILEGTSANVGNAATAIFTLVAAYIVAFSQSLKLTLILTSTVLAVVLSIAICTAYVIHCDKHTLAPSSAAGTITEEAFSSIRNVTAFNAQNNILRTYQHYMSKAERWSLKSKVSVATSIGVITGVVCLNYGLAFWMGARFLLDGQLNLGNILTTVLSIMIGATYLGIIGPSIHAISSAVAATGHIFSVIDRQSPIDPQNVEGIELPNPQGVIELHGIKMIYPSRPDALVTNDLDIIFPKGKTTALVGESGSGKSTVIGLIERFYSPVSGSVFFDGVNVKDLNLKWLRQQMALVQQEPIIFNTTVTENIAQGLIGSKHEHISPKERIKMIEDASKMSDAHDFILGLPNGYHTNVGQQGTLLSGGQKQRIAIARAVIGDPKVLLLDEATSALDTESEKIVQAALDKAAEGRTTIIIAHRISTVRAADNIIVMAAGAIIEQGSHNELIGRRGPYYQLVQAQKLDEEQGESIEILENTYQTDGDENNSALDITDVGDGLELEVLSSSSDTRITNEKAKKNDSLWTLIKFIASFNKPEFFIAFLGLIASIFAGGGTPVQAILFAKTIVNLSRPQSQYNSLQSDVDFWSLMFLVLGIEQFLAYLGQGVAFAICSERLLRRSKSQALRSILRQNIAFFDENRNGAGAMSTFLNAEVMGVAGLSGAVLGTILTAITTLVASIVLSCTFYWKLGLVCTATIPILLACGFLRIWLLAQYRQKINASYQASATYACEAVAAIRTIASLTREDDVVNQYHQKMLQQEKENLGRILKSGSLYAISQAAVLFVTALAFWYGGTLIASSEIGLYQFFLCFSAIVFGTQMAGGIFAFAPEIAHAKAAAQSLKKQLETKPSIDTWSKSGQKVDKVRGLVEFKDVYFSYPSRPHTVVLSGLNLKADPRTYIALVGASGCGKSSTLALLESFYSPTSGSILLDGQNISELNLLEYRKHLAIVMQEPSLYQGTIRENILLGVEIGTNISDAQIEQACKSANIYELIMSLPDGYETVVGSRGSMLSGGQKQRIAIARALLRDPAVLLLDEATSSLDSHSESVVQTALDAASAGRTTIAIAHRLSTIQKADNIYVFDKGKVAESGTHAELLSLKGLYYNLVESQRLQHGSHA